MRNRFDVPSTLGLALTVVLFAPLLVGAQASSSGASAKSPATKAPDTKSPDAKSGTKIWSVPRTPDGHPDFHGYWTNLSFTPLERPAKYQGREFLTEKETEENFKAGVQSSFEPDSEKDVYRDSDLFDPTSVDYDAVTYGLSPWQNGVRPNPRTSLVVDPPDGRIPQLTPEAKARRPQRANFAYVVEDHDGGGVVHADGPLDLGIGTTCITQSGGPPLMPGLYNSGLFIAQNLQAVMIETEVGSELRIIHLDGGPHSGANIQLWHGDSRGHWEGDALVVETTNFRPENVFRNANPRTLKITERFTRVSADEIEYKFTVDDPSTWTKPWSAIVPLSAYKGPLFEYDCSENNNDAVNILAGARRTEREAKGASGKPISQKSN